MAGAGFMPSHGAPPADKWVGVWTLDTTKSSFGTVLAPGAPVGMTIVSQTLKIKETAYAL
jgi:hypothetical protein